MKKILFYASALALLMASCASDEPNGKDKDFVGEPANAYMSITMVTPPVISATKATPEEVTNGTYIDGDANENNVQRVRFYFFNDGGGAFGVRKNVVENDYNNYIDWYPETSDIEGPDHDMTVEKQLNARIAINLQSSEKPAKVVAIINPPSAILNLANNSANAEGINGPSLQDLLDQVANYETGLTSGNFVMSNSVYVEDDKVMYATKVEPGMICSTIEEALLNPVVIYVERVVARVDMAIAASMKDNGIKTITNDTIIYKLKNITLNDNNSTGNNATSTPLELYVKFLGWNCTSTTGTSRLIKDVNPEWKPYQILGAPMIWNTDDFHRSFWAINPQNVSFNFGNLIGGNYPQGATGTNVNPANGHSFLPAGNYQKIYIQENAAPYDEQTAGPTGNATKIIVAAQLCNAEGKGLTLGEWGGEMYTLDGLKNRICTVLQDLCTTTATGYRSIQPSDIMFTPTDPAGVGDQSNYYVYVTLTPESAGLTWYLRNGTTYTEYTNATDLKNYIRNNTNHAKIWTYGYTYYYFDIRHLGVAENYPGYLGIVRNHIYQINLTSINGLGCPVFDPWVEIIPEPQTPDASVLSAEVKILQWRLVSQDYQLTW